MYNHVWFSWIISPIMSIYVGLRTAFDLILFLSTLLRRRWIIVQTTMRNHSLKVHALSLLARWDVRAFIPNRVELSSVPRYSYVALTLRYGCGILGFLLHTAYPDNPFRLDAFLIFRSLTKWIVYMFQPTRRSDSILRIWRGRRAPYQSTTLVSFLLFIVQRVQHRTNFESSCVKSFHCLFTRNLIKKKKKTIEWVKICDTTQHNFD